MKALFQKYLAVVVLLFIGALAQATTVFVPPIEGKGVEASDNEAIEELVKTGVEKVSGYHLSTDADKADLHLRVKVLKLGSAFVIKADKIENHKIIFSTRMKAPGIEEMDVVALRVVRSALSEKEPKDAATVEDVTAEEERSSSRRFQAVRQWQFGFGIATSSNLNVKGQSTQWSLGYNWSLDPQFDLQLMWDLYLPKISGDARFTDLSLGLAYHFSTGKHTPFVGADIGYGAASAADGDNNSVFGSVSSDDTASGWVLGLSGGMKFFRTTSVNLGLVLRYSYMFEKTRVSDLTPSVTSVRLIVYY